MAEQSEQPKTTNEEKDKKKPGLEIMESIRSKLTEHEIVVVIRDRYGGNIHVVENDVEKVSASHFNEGLFSRWKIVAPNVEEHTTHFQNIVTQKFLRIFKENDVLQIRCDAENKDVAGTEFRRFVDFNDGKFCRLESTGFPGFYLSVNKEGKILLTEGIGKDSCLSLHLIAGIHHHIRPCMLVVPISVTVYIVSREWGTFLCRNSSNTDVSMQTGTGTSAEWTITSVASPNIYSVKYEDDLATYYLSASGMSVSLSPNNNSDSQKFVVAQQKSEWENIASFTVKGTNHNLSAWPQNMWNQNHVNFTTALSFWEYWRIIAKHT